MTAVGMIMNKDAAGPKAPLRSALNEAAQLAPSTRPPASGTSLLRDEPLPDPSPEPRAAVSPPPTLPGTVERRLSRVGPETPAPKDSRASPAPPGSGAGPDDDRASVGSTLSRRPSMLQEQMTLERGLERQRERRQSTTLKRRESMVSNQSTTSTDSRTKGRRGHRRRASHRRQSGQNSEIPSAQPQHTSAIASRANIAGSFFGRHSSVSPSTRSEAWKDEEVQEVRDEYYEEDVLCWRLYDCTDSFRAKLLAFMTPRRVLQSREETRWGRFWVAILTVVVLYNLLAIPFRIGFRATWYHPDWKAFFYTCDYVGDAILLFDIFLNFRTVFISDGLEVKDPADIVVHYARNGFKWHFVASLPIDLIFWYNPWAKALSRLPRLIRLSSTLNQLDELSRSTELGNIIQITKLFSSVMILCHWMACLYFFVAYHDGFAPIYDPESFTPAVGVRHWIVSRQYLYGLSWSVDVISGAFVITAPPFSDLQRGFMILCDFAHVLVIAFFIGSVEQLLLEWNRDAEEFRARMMKLNQFMGRRHLHKELQQRIRNYYFHAWSRQGAFDNPQILRDLPVNLRTEVNVCTHGKVLAKVPLFKSLDKSFLNQLTEKIKLRIYAPGDLVVAVGEEGDEMFILNRGNVDIENREGKVLVTLGEGSVIGEVAFFSPNSKRTATVRAKTWCDFACLEKQDFMAVASRFPEERMAVESLAHARLAKDLLRKKISDHPLFKGCEADLIAKVADRFGSYEFVGGETLYVQGEPADAWLFVGLGKVVVSEQVLGVTKKHDKTVKTELEAGEFLDVIAFMQEGKRKDMCKALGSASILALDKTAFDQILLEQHAFDIVNQNSQEIARKARLASAKHKFKRAMARLRTSNLLGSSVSREPSIRESDSDSVADMQAAGETLKTLSDEVLDSKLKEALKLITNISSVRTQRLSAKPA
ncbi:uncharacterized protein MONBRDRAFT_30002 [Monosiga brevicollis MX1]|uniref:Cyclic nucleotide-binding domain-containing protein n=1 Tax=Monosiga brevicollis TaxID=81824 RepID=A9VCQ9_MONBE|nr:uncharacterized protein MONBRDRAFT_30002 [Monosiga brevicollis MX1]EDQ84691.1 predicted protein [Monosiga brevicollis MX1]|eukprot:XP_001750477.1 hypothetical protein [Monosiga brevicollis MX1]